MKKLTFIFNASAMCMKSISVPMNFETKGKSMIEIYDEVFYRYGDGNAEYLLNNTVGMDEFHNMHIEIEDLHSVFEYSNDNLNIIQD